MKISFRLVAPQNVSTELNINVGNINLSSLSGTHNFSASLGSLKLDKLKEINGKTSVGSVNSKYSTSNFTLFTSAGSLNFVALEGSISANTDAVSANAVRVKET